MLFEGRRKILGKKGFTGGITLLLCALLVLPLFVVRPASAEQTAEKPTKSDDAEKTSEQPARPPLSLLPEENPEEDGAPAQEDVPASGVTATGKIVENKTAASGPRSQEQLGKINLPAAGTLTSSSSALTRGSTAAGNRPRTSSPLTGGGGSGKTVSQSHAGLLTTPPGGVAKQPVKEAGGTATTATAPKADVSKQQQNKDTMSAPIGRKPVSSKQAEKPTTSNTGLDESQDAGLQSYQNATADGTSGGGLLGGRKASTSSSASSSAALGNLLTALLCIGLLLFGIWLGKAQGGRNELPRRVGQPRNSNAASAIKIVDNIALGQGRQLTIVEVNGEALVLGVTSQNVALLDKYSLHRSAPERNSQQLAEEAESHEWQRLRQLGAASTAVANGNASFPRTISIEDLERNRTWTRQQTPRDAQDVSAYAGDGLAQRLRDRLGRPS
jgi:flagellar biogenesis protein FliO